MIVSGIMKGLCETIRKMIAPNISRQTKCGMNCSHGFLVSSGVGVSGGAVGIWWSCGI